VKSFEEQKINRFDSKYLFIKTEKSSGHS
jgi:hypothetical protein